MTTRVRQRADGLNAKNPSGSLAERKGSSRVRRTAPVMKIVGTDSADVELGLLGGKIPCPDCSGALGPWGNARPRIVRFHGDIEWRTPRRARCRTCHKTHVLLPNDLLVRRRDGVAVIGDALTRASSGAGFRSLAAKLGRPPETVRGWLRAFRSSAEKIRAHFTRWAVALDSESFDVPPTGSAFGDAVGAIAAAGSAAVRKGIADDPWQFASAITIGGLLCKQILCNTTCPWASP